MIWGEKGTFKMQLSEIADEQAYLWCPQELGSLSFLWTCVPCCCLSRSRFLGLTKSLLSPARWGEVLPCVRHSWVEIGFFGLCLVFRPLGSWSWQAKRKADFVLPARLCHSATKCGWTDDPRTLQVWTHHNVCRPGVVWIVFRISIDEIKVLTQQWWFFNLTTWTNLETFSQHGRKHMCRVNAVLFSLPKLSQRWEDTLRCSEQRP